MATFCEHLRYSIIDLLEQNANAFVIGQDIADPYGGAFKVTRSLSSRFPNAVISAPISEAALVGYAIGRAVSGHRGIAEIMFGDFITLAIDQIINQGLKIQSMYGCQVDIPLVIRFPTGGYRGYGPTHSQSFEGLFGTFPELPVFCPSLFDDPGIFLTHALSLGRLTIFAEHKMLYPQDIMPREVDGIGIDVKSFGDLLSRKSVVKILQNVDQPHKIFIISYGYLSTIACQAMMLSYRDDEQIVGVISCCSLHDVDFSPLLGQLKQATKFLIVHELPPGVGWAARVGDGIFRLFRDYGLAFPEIKHIGSKGSTIPSAIDMELEHLPSLGKLLEELK